MSARDYVEKDYYAALGVPKDAAAARQPRERHVVQQERVQRQDDHEGDLGLELVVPDAH